MLIVISDLHMADGTSSNNVSPRAFSHFFDYIKDSLKKEYKELVLVFAGDTFDLLRSEYWMGVQVSEKPWGFHSIESGAESGEQDQGRYTIHLQNIFNNIITVNNESLEIIKQTIASFPIPVQPFLILGNHDRMLNKINGFSDILTNSFGNVSVIDGPYENKEYGVTVRHGHEYDSYNYEKENIPIGDVNTVEIFVKLPYIVKEKFPDLEDELKSIEDIRPQWRVFDYLKRTYTGEEISAYIEKCIDSTIDNFFTIPYVRHWFDRNDTMSPLDSTDRLEYMLRFFKVLPVNWAERFMKMFSYFDMKETQYEAAAGKEKGQYVAYGHTHTDDIAFLGTADSLHRYYINTGTWRERVIASEKGSFSRYKTMTYAIFYKKEERHTLYPSFELWNGALRE